MNRISAITITCILAFALLSAANTANAQKDMPDALPAIGGYTGPGPEMVSVKQALSMPHDTVVSLEGKITRYLGRDDYAFADSSGTVELKIGPYAWMGQQVAESDTVVLQGEVKIDRKQTGVHIRVHRVIKKDLPAD